MIRRVSIFLMFITLSPLVSAIDNGVELIIVRDENKLLVRQDTRTLKSYHVAIGSGGRQAKLEEGDRKTPTGKYRVHQVRDSDQFHLFIHLNYPNVNDAKIALKSGRIDRKQYRRILGAHLYNELPPQNTVLGGAIGIHGIGVETKDKLEIHGLSNWTKGCIAMRNDEVDELKQYISAGTPVTIINKMADYAQTKR